MPSWCLVSVMWTRLVVRLHATSIIMYIYNIIVSNAPTTVCVAATLDSGLGTVV